MLKSKIIEKLNKKHKNLKRSQITTIVELVFDTIISSLIDSKAVELRNFGRWSIKNIKAKYNERNQKTGEIIYIPEKKKISFKMSKNFKRKINED